MIEDSRSSCLFIFRLFDCGKLGRAATLSRVKIGIKIHLVFIATLREKNFFQIISDLLITIIKVCE
jgi:hypothetical protein